MSLRATYRLLLKVTREHAWEEWLLYLLRGVEESAIGTIGKEKLFLHPTFPGLLTREGNAFSHYE